MRRSILWIPSLVVLAACGSSGTTPEPEAGVAVSPIRIDFGPTRAGTAKTQTVLVENTGEVEYAVTLAKGSPFDAAFSFEPEKGTARPGEVVRVTVTYAPAAPGVHTAVILARPGNNQIDSVRVELAGSTFADPMVVRLSTGALDFGAVLIGERKRLTLPITNPAGMPVEVAVAGGTNAAICGSASGGAFCVDSPQRPFGGGTTLSLGASETLPLEVTFRPSVAGRRETGTIRLATCALPACEIELRFAGVGVATVFSCDPVRLDFGRVGTATCATSRVRCANAGDEQRTVVSRTLVARTSTAFSLPGRFVPKELVPGDAVEIPVAYCPTRASNDAGSLTIATDDPDPQRRLTTIALRGSGGGPDLEVTPRALDFGRVGVGAAARLTIALRNRGTEPVTVTAAAPSGAFTLTGVPAQPLAPGATAGVEVELRPTAAGALNAEVVFTSNDLDEPEIRVRITGTGVTVPPCSYEVWPASMDFGIVERSRFLTRAVEIRNTGATECTVSTPRLLPSSDPSFSLPDTEPATRTIAAGSSATIGVLFSPVRVGAISGELEIPLSSGANPFARVRLEGSGADNTLLVSPSDLDFGVVELSCSALTRTVQVFNTSTRPVFVTDIRLATSPDSVFSLSDLPTLTATIAPAGSIQLDVGFMAQGGAEYAGAIEILTGTTAATRETHVVGLRGRGARNARQVDRFEQLGAPQVDILWIIDNSGSMSEEQASLADNFLSFVRFAEAQALDYQLAITTTDVTAGGAHGRFVSAAANLPKIVTPRTLPSPEMVFTRNARLGTSGSGNEQGLQGAYLALSNPLISSLNAGFIRPDATLSIIFVSDEEDSSPYSEDFYVSFFLSLKGARNANAFSASAIVGDAPSGCNGPGGSATAGLKYLNVAERTGGVFQSICTRDWASALENLSTTAFGFKSRFFLSSQPDTTTLVVSIDGVPVSAREPGGAVRWDYEFGTNSILFSPFATPEPGAEIVAEYVAECQ